MGGEKPPKLPPDPETDALLDQAAKDRATGNLTPDEAAMLEKGLKNLPKDD